MVINEFKYLTLIFLGLILFSFTLTASEKNKVKDDIKVSNEILLIEEFIEKVSKNDVFFDEILIEQLTLNYRKDLTLPVRDIVLSVKGQYEFFLSQHREDPSVIISLSKLFPYTGTDISVSYENVPSFSSTVSGSQLQFLISQPIAENAFGKATRLKDKIVGIEIDVIRYQIVEAYEDYLASLISIYYDWYAAYGKMKISEISYKENLKLQDNIYEREKQKIALAVDVNKVELLVLGKKEDLIGLTESYNNLINLVKKAVRCPEEVSLIPSDPDYYQDFDVVFERDYEKFTKESRTYDILDLLENKSSLEVKKNADDLMPSTNLLIGYKIDGDKWKIRNEDNLFYAGISVDWPFSDQVEKAEYEVARIEYRKTKLSNQNKYLELYTNLKNIHLGINREKELIIIADKKLRLSIDIFKDEAENYSFGKITLNDYIVAVNRVDQVKFSKISHILQLKKYLVEWMRLTDNLVDKVALNPDLEYFN